LASHRPNASPYLSFRKSSSPSSVLPREILGFSIFCLKAEVYPARLKPSGWPLAPSPAQIELFEVYFNNNHEDLSNISTCTE
jgi:hypothetical protein